MNRLLARIRRGRVLAEGALGTRLMKAGLQAGPVMDAVPLRRPALLERLHRSSRAAGVEALKTHTFALPGTGEESRRILDAAVRIARRAAGRLGFVLGSLGPLSGFETRIEWMAEAGVDALLLETFQDGRQLCRGVKRAKGLGLPVIALMTSGSGSGLRRAREAGADWVGVNCVDPEEAFAALSPLAGWPLAALPSAGLPGHGGIHPLSPGRWAEGTARLAGLGVSLLGGCCGTTPAHLRALSLRIP